MKEYLLARRGQVYSVTSTAELERRLQQGWMLVQPVARSGRASPMRAMRQKRLTEGWRRLDFSIEPWQAELVDLVRKAGETYSELLTRLLLEHCSNNDKSESQAHK